MPAQCGISAFQVLREQLRRAARKKFLCLAQSEHDAGNQPGEVAFLKTITARCCPQSTTSPALKCHRVAMELLSLGVVVSEGQLCTLPSPQLCSIPLGILQIPRPAPLPVCMSPQQWWCQDRCHMGDMLYSAIYSIFSFLSQPLLAWLLLGTCALLFGGH